MQRIVPNFWFDHNAEDAVDFYLSVFKDGKINAMLHYPETEKEGLADFQKDLAGKVLTIDFEISGYRFTAINADTTFKPTPSISFFYTCDTKEEMDDLWGKLAEGGKALMELGKYPFSEYYGWVQDRFGYTWQLMLNNPKGDRRPKIVPSLMFTQARDGQAEDAMKFYTSVFKESEISKNLNRYPSDMPDRQGKISYADFRLFDQWIAVMDGGKDHDFTFTPAISLMVLCKDQEEIDYYWEKLSANPDFEQCGWLEDKYGVSWQISPENMDELVRIPGAYKRMMNMKKLDIAGLQGANKNAITVETLVKAPMSKVWEYWNKPDHIVHWAFAVDNWECPAAERDLRVGGKFKTTMAAKDKSASFDITGTYTIVKENELIEYDMSDERHVKEEFIQVPEGVKIIVTFDPENENSPEMQKAGWQAISDNFKKYVEGNS